LNIEKKGAACVLASMQTIARLKLKINIVGVLALAENAIDANSYKPHAIISSLKGLSVEVNNTDAEGRLCLADALTWVQRQDKPHTIVDFATLTGACVVALGEYCAGCFGNDNALVDRLRSAGTEAHERVWPMPILDEHEKELKSGIFADLRSTGIKTALFLVVPAEHVFGVEFLNFSC
jgi:leucyl aminopeptidase